MRQCYNYRWELRESGEQSTGLALPVVQLDDMVVLISAPLAVSVPIRFTTCDTDVFHPLEYHIATCISFILGYNLG